MPANTTIGTNGFIAPFVREHGDDPAATWMTGGDRFALAVLVLETFAAEAGCAFNGDGCLLDQDEIQARAGATLDRAFAAAAPRAPEAVSLFARALAAATPRDCPTPQQWLRCLERNRSRAARTISGTRTGFVHLDPAAFVALDPTRFIPLSP
jgi:hypothetical protein